MGQEIDLRMTWSTTSLDFAREFVDSSQIRITVNGEALSEDHPDELLIFWQEPFEDAFGVWKVSWVYPYGLLKPGIHNISAETILSKKVTDGFD